MENLAIRRKTMQAVKSKNTLPEMQVRRLLHSAGYRFRLHDRKLPGCPDIIFPARRKIIFVHGCFWHGHQCSRGARTPKTNTDYWTKKIDRNRARDNAAIAELEKLGWSVRCVWECEIGSTLWTTLRKFLDRPE